MDAIDLGWKRCFGASFAKIIVFFLKKNVYNISKKRVTELNKVNITYIFTRGSQSLSSLMAQRDHDPALSIASNSPS